MSVLLDTNILTRSAQPGHPMHKAAVDAVDILRTRGEQLYVVPQNMVEFWAVATRPISVNGLGMTPTQAQAELVLIKSLFRLLPDTPAIYDEWEEHARCANSGRDERSCNHQHFDFQRRRLQTL